MTVTIRYFAMLRERAGVDSEALSVDATGATPAALYDRLTAQHAFGLDRGVVRAAVNGRYVSWDAPVADGDEVVFIPPVSGG
tara:strand:+ start:17 stop:262 length:246 start_codon:yes stop_codon:yes gene_type:complete